MSSTHTDSPRPLVPMWVHGSDLRIDDIWRENQVTRVSAPTLIPSCVVMKFVALQYPEGIPGRYVEMRSPYGARVKMTIIDSDTFGVMRAAK